MVESSPPTPSQPPAWPRPPNSLWALTFGHPATRPMFWGHIELHKHRLPQPASLPDCQPASLPVGLLSLPSPPPLPPGPSFIDASLPPCKSMTSTPAPGCRTTCHCIQSPRRRLASTSQKSRNSKPARRAQAVLVGPSYLTTDF